MVTQFSGSDKMSDCKDSTEKDANTTDDDVGDAEEGIASSDNGSGRDDDGLGTLVLSSREMVIDDKVIGSWPHSLGVVALVKLAKGGKTRRTHPDLKSFPFFEVRRRSIFGVSIGVAFLPVGRWHNFIVAILSLFVKILVAIP
jgi:hypothetical protein